MLHLRYEPDGRIRSKQGEAVAVHIHQGISFRLVSEVRGGASDETNLADDLV